MADGFIAFELDLMGAVMNQLIPSLDAMGSAPLSLANAQALPDAQGVYLLIYDGSVHRTEIELAHIAFVDRPVRDGIKAALLVLAEGVAGPAVVSQIFVQVERA